MAALSWNCVLAVLLLVPSPSSARTATTYAAATGAEDQAEDIGSPLTVAQCRAQCLQRLTERPGQCLQSPDCYMCWENCQLLQSNFPVWGAMCNEKNLCFPGCQQACAFHRRLRGPGSRRQQQAVVLTGGLAAVRARGSSAWWPAPASAPASGPLVYVLMRRTAAPQLAWTQITQTVELSAPLPEDMVPRGQWHHLRQDLRVLVVGPEGLQTIYSPAAPAPAPATTSTPGPRTSTEGAASQRRINTAIKPASRVPSPSQDQPPWTLREVSLIHQKVLVIAELSWAPRGPPGGVYLVTWEVDGGGLKGNLFTDSTHVTLSLWPETVYHIQVEQVSESRQSATLVLDTRRALPSTLGSRGPTASSRIPLSIPQPQQQPQRRSPGPAPAPAPAPSSSPSPSLAPPAPTPAPSRMHHEADPHALRNWLLTLATSFVVMSLLFGALLAWRCRGSLFQRWNVAVGDSSPFIGALDGDVHTHAPTRKVCLLNASFSSLPLRPEPGPSDPQVQRVESCRTSPSPSTGCPSPSWRHVNMASSWTFGPRPEGSVYSTTQRV